MSRVLALLENKCWVVIWGSEWARSEDWIQHAYEERKALGPFDQAILFLLYRNCASENMLIFQR